MTLKEPVLLLHSENMTTLPYQQNKFELFLKSKNYLNPCEIKEINLGLKNLKRAEKQPNILFCINTTIFEGEHNFKSVY